MNAVKALFLASLLVIAVPAFAVNPDEILDDPVLEERARDLSKGLRCVVCRNQSIDDSNAGIARDMRLVLRERLLAGDSNKEAIDYLVDRYGTFILLSPPVSPSTYLLWAGPGILLIVTVYGFSRLWRRRQGPTDAGDELSEEDQKILDRLMNEGDPKS